MSGFETELAVALSARAWSDGLHRFLADHGGARVRLTATGQDDLLSESFDVLLIDDVCSFLTPRLIDLVRQAGRQVIGVYDPIEFADGKDRLLECGVADVIEASAHPDEFLRVIDRVSTLVSHRSVGRDGTEDAFDVPIPAGRSIDRVVAVAGPVGGTGSTEVALALALRLSQRGSTVVLVDGDDHAPSLAQRLGLPLHPNLRTAIDVLEHRTGSLDDMLHEVEPGMRFLAGQPNIRDWAEIRPRQVVDVVRELTRSSRHVVVNVGSQIESFGFSEGNARYGVARALIENADRVVAVGLATPVGVARLLGWVAVATPLVDPEPIDLLLNRSPRDQFRRGELVEEITRSYRPASFGFLPEDPQLAQAAWNGQLTPRGRFRRSLERWADRFMPVGSVP